MPKTRSKTEIEDIVQKTKGMSYRQIMKTHSISPNTIKEYRTKLGYINKSVSKSSKSNVSVVKLKYGGIKPNAINKAMTHPMKILRDISTGKKIRSVDIRFLAKALTGREYTSEAQSVVEKELGKKIETYSRKKSP